MVRDCIIVMHRTEHTVLKSTAPLMFKRRLETKLAQIVHEIVQAFKASSILVIYYYNDTKILPIQHSYDGKWLKEWHAI